MSAVRLACRGWQACRCFTMPGWLQRPTPHVAAPHLGIILQCCSPCALIVPPGLSLLLRTRADGPLLSAVRSGAWVLLDELNLASQTVLEGLNAVLDHRAEVGTWRSCSIKAVGG